MLSFAFMNEQEWAVTDHDRLFQIEICMTMWKMQKL